MEMRAFNGTDCCTISVAGYELLPTFHVPDQFPTCGGAGCELDPADPVLNRSVMGSAAATPVAGPIASSAPAASATI